MLKWDVHSPEEEPIRIPKLFTWLTITMGGGTFCYVLYLWYRWVEVMLQNSQTILFWTQL